MTTSLYDMSVPTFLQTVRAVRGFLDRAVLHCDQAGTDPEELVTARLFPDMAPFWFQIECVDNFSVWGLEAMRTGAFKAPDLAGVVAFAELQVRMARTEVALTALEPEEVNARAGRDLDLLIHHVSPGATPLTSETFLLSFLFPNFYFHAVTAYNILRVQGVPVGKRDFEGQLRTRPI